MQLVEPVLHVTESAKKIEAGSAEIESGIECVKELLAFVDAGLLLGGGRKLRRRAGSVGGAVAHFELREDAFQLLVGNLLLEAGDLRLGIQLAQASSEFGDLDVVLALRLLGLGLRAQGVGRGFSGFGVEPNVEVVDAD